MYAAYNLELSSSDYERLEASITQSNSLVSKLGTDNFSKLTEYLATTGHLDASEITNDWFPNFEADVFISHSHGDLNEVKKFAAWLKKNFGLTAFIDSELWGYANDLLKQIDNKYCKFEDSDSYSYERRNYSTSHVHMMLSMALMKMINSTECIFFLNTPKSVPKKDPKTIYTESPWISLEILASKIIALKNPRPSLPIYDGMVLKEEAALSQESFKVQYEIDLSHMETLDYVNLEKWKQSITAKKHHLDTLYHLFPSNKKVK